MIICLGTHGWETAEKIRSGIYQEFKKNALVKVKVFFRGRGERNLWKRTKTHKINGCTYATAQVQFKRVADSRDLPLKYARRMAVYLNIEELKDFKEISQHIQHIQRGKV